MGTISSNQNTKQDIAIRATLAELRKDKMLHKGLANTDAVRLDRQLAAMDRWQRHVREQGQLFSRRPRK